FHQHTVVPAAGGRVGARAARAPDPRHPLLPVEHEPGRPGDQRMSSTAGLGAPRPRQSFKEWITNPWAETRFMWVVGFAYVIWMAIPVVTAVLFSFNKGRSDTQWEGFSLRWYTWDPTGSVLHDPSLPHVIVQSLKLVTLTAVFAVPLGVAFALALHRWHGRGAGTSNFLMLFSFVTPD